jgi:hypothetical protein
MARKRATGTLPTEDQEQIMRVTWMMKKAIPFFAIPNGGSRNLLEAMKLKRMGVQPGVPDIFIPISIGQYHGMFIEMKRSKGGVVSDNQKYWIDALSREGYYCVVACGFDNAMEMISGYLS